MITYEQIHDNDIECIKDLCNALMKYQKRKATIHPEYFDNMSFETRMLPSFKSALQNFVMVAKDGEDIIAYVYSNISPKETYDNDFATFFDMDSVDRPEVGCLSQFFIMEGYRNHGIGSILFNASMEWLKSFPDIQDIFIYVSNGNHNALDFYKDKGFRVSHQILEGFITVLRNSV